MKKIIPLLLLVLAGCSKYDKKYQHVKIDTEYGKIIVKLYNSTPNHSKNFIKLVDEKFYDGIIFHRVIKDFVIQGGDPETKNPKPGVLYGEKDSGYLIDPEFNDTIIHKKGVIAMARESDDVNPEKRSSGSQFYIVIGKVFTNDQLNQLEQKINNERYRVAKENFLAKNQLKGKDQVDSKLDSLKQAVPVFKFSAKQRGVYTTAGGLPHLDGNYTIFGEVVEGLDVVEKISLVPTDENDRPKQDIKIKIRQI
ncbi:MAG: peptidylprolyl isomerase [Bacteroidales bacterium]